MELKSSLLVSKQLPEFVREEYPLFVSFLESYYEFLETERFTNGTSQKNNLIEKLKDLKNISDIDYSLDEFEEQFYNTFISYLPKDTIIGKDFLIKNILPLYKSKGTEKSFRLLFRLLFGEEIEFQYPKNDVLRVSDGKWIIDNVLETGIESYNEIISNGTQKDYNLLYEVDYADIKVYINDVLTEDYFIRKEVKKIYFNTTPTLNSVIKIYYLSPFNTTFFKNRQIVGIKSKATAIVEKVSRRNIGGLDYYQFFINQKNLLGTFVDDEPIEIKIVNDDGTLSTFKLQTLSSNCFKQLPGLWTTNDGFLSCDQIRLQSLVYYTDFTYIISSKIQFQKYKDIVKVLLNPLGTEQYARFKLYDTAQANTLSIVVDEFSRQLAGSVNVQANNYFIYGTNTYFALANTTGLLAEGTYILVNSEIRIVNSIINNTTITVSEPYSFSYNGEITTIFTTPYRALTTEYWRELAIILEGPRTIVITTED